MKSEIIKFKKERKQAVNKMTKDTSFIKLSKKWLARSVYHKYNYNYSWMGRPIIKYPDDMVVMQELLWKLKPDLVIETGIAHGGSIIFTASILKMMNIKKFKVIGVDIDIRKHNLSEIKKSNVYKYMKLFEGSSNDQNILRQINNIRRKFKKVLVILDSNHSKSHVLQELKNYSKFVSKNSYIVLPDTYIDFLPKGTFKKWKKGDSTFAALKEFLLENKSFKIDNEINKKSLISEAICGYVKKIS